MQKNFARIESQNIPRSRFNRSHGHKTTFDSGKLIPVFLDELVPGDNVSLDVSCISRLATPIYPLMDNMYLDVQFFAVPMRLLWDNFKKFMGERRNPNDTIDQYTIPRLGSQHQPQFTVGSIYDYMGIPPSTAYSVSSSYAISALPFRAYNLIWNEWYRDQNLQEVVQVPTGDGPDGNFAGTLYKLLPRGKRHDYFTSCLPWPQRSQAVEIPISGITPVQGAFYVTDANGIYDSALGTNTSGQPVVVPNMGLSAALFANPDTASTILPLHVDLSAATGITINELRDFITLQQFSELDARGGTRYIEILQSHFGVTSSDARLQRPEFLGSISNVVGVEPVRTTGGNDSDARPVGDLGATAYSAFGSQKAFTYSAEEHCYVIGLASVRADLTYSQGIDRLFTRQIREDFYWPSFANLGEQPVFNYEIMAKHAQPTGVFGYQERYAEYRFKKSVISGLMRPDVPSSLAVWNLSQNLPATVALNPTFIEETPPIDRVVAVTDEPEFIADFFFNYVCERPLPMYGIPGLVRL